MSFGSTLHLAWNLFSAILQRFFATDVCTCETEKALLVVRYGHCARSFILFFGFKSVKGACNKSSFCFFVICCYVFIAEHLMIILFIFFSCSDFFFQASDKICLIPLGFVPRGESLDRKSKLYVWKFSSMEIGWPRSINVISRKYKFQRTCR